MNQTRTPKILFYQYVAIIPHENERAIIQSLPSLQSNSQCFDCFQLQGRALHSESNPKNIFVSTPRDRNIVRFCGCSYRCPCAKLHKPTHVQKSQKVSAIETARTNLNGLRSLPQLFV